MFKKLFHRQCCRGRVSDTNSEISASLRYIDAGIISNGKWQKSVPNSSIIFNNSSWMRQNIWNSHNRKQYLLEWRQLPIDVSRYCKSFKFFLIWLKSSITGDSGGPLTVTNAGRQVQVGIVSFGSDTGCQKGYPTAFARITSFHSWIQTNTGITIS